VAQATAMPRTERKVLIGLRSRLRTIIFVGCVRKRPMPVFSISVTLNFAGGSGRMASAGGCLAACQRECNVPTRAEEILMIIAATITHGFSIKVRAGNR